MSRFKWINIFVRDILIILVIGFMQIKTNFNSKSLFLITGMMLVIIVWQLNDYLKQKR